MTALFFYLTITVIIMVGIHFFNQTKYTVVELGMQVLSSLLVIGVVIIIDSFSSTYDYKFVHGVVRDKEAITKNCRQYWSEYKDSWCENHDTKTVYEQYTTIVDGKTVTKTRSHTEYYPTYRWERKYFVDTTLGNYRIASVDEQGVNYPSRYNIVAKGDPVTSYKYYTNYVKAASSSLFKYEDDNFKDIDVPRNEVVDYYNINQFYTTSDVSLPVSSKVLNKKLAVMNSSIKSGANLVFYVSKYDNKFPNALQVKWQGFKINDVVVVLGLDKTGEMYEYVNVYSWSESSMVDVRLKDIFFFSKPANIVEDMDKAVDIVNTTFTEPNEEKFSYLKYKIEMSNVALVILLLWSFIATPLISIFLVKEEIA